MVLPITVFGHPTLKKVAQDIDKDYPELEKLISDMFDTMEGTGDGIGLAAPQVNKSIRLFVIDASDLEEHYPECKDFKKVFINAQITKRGGDDVIQEEACLSLPGLSEEVERPDEITITYYDENWKKYEETYSGMLSRIIQHEYDHLEGMVYTDHITPLQRMFMKKKLRNLSTGKTRPAYRVLLPPQRRK